MKFAVLALVACSSLALLVEADNIYEREGHLNDLRERLGHFKSAPYTDLYKQYATAFVYPKHRHERSKDDYRNYMPSGDECMVFFRAFRIAQYVVKDFEELVVLDACLGYLFDSDDHELDAETSSSVKDHLVQLKDDEVLQKLYSETKVNELGEHPQTCVANLLLSNILAKHQYRDVPCNNHFLQMYLQFAECQQGVISAEQRETDSYLKIIYSVLKERVQSCFEIEIDHINFALRKAYRNDFSTRAKLSVLSKFKKLSTQQKERMWPTPVTRLLSAVQNTTREVNLREVHELVRGFYVGNQKLTDIFTANIAYYADNVLKPSPTDKGGEQAAQMRYRDLIDDTCRFFRSSDSESDYDYATPLIRMVELLNHVELFDLTPGHFIKKMLTRAHETAPVYLAVSACNLLTFTEAAIDRPTKNKKLHYKVMFVPDTSKMIKWLDAGYY